MKKYPSHRMTGFAFYNMIWMYKQNEWLQHASFSYKEKGYNFAIEIEKPKTDTILFFFDDQI